MGKLAINGGTPVKESIGDYAAWPVGGETERENLRRVLHSGVWGTLGEESARFSENYARCCNTKYALPVANGTISLEIILRALCIGRGDEIILPPYTFIASVSAIATVGAVPVFADIDPETYCISACDIEKRITEKTRAIMGVHIGGRPFDCEAVARVAEKHGLYLIEDAAQAHGARWLDSPVGSIGECGSFSFQASKNISCGEGGVITTNNEELYHKMWSIHNNGRRFGDKSYDHPFLGTNGRMAEWQAAILNARMATLDRDIDLRMENAAYLDEQLAKFPFIEPLKRDERITRNSYHLYIFKYKSEGLGGIGRKRFISALNAENVCAAATGYSQPIYDMEILYSDAFTKTTGVKYENPKESLPCNETAAHSEGAWMYHSSLLGTRADTERIIEAISKLAENADELAGGE